MEPLRISTTGYNRTNDRNPFLPLAKWDNYYTHTYIILIVKYNYIDQQNSSLLALLYLLAY